MTISLCNCRSGYCQRRAFRKLRDYFHPSGIHLPFPLIVGKAPTTKCHARTAYKRASSFSPNHFKNIRFWILDWATRVEPSLWNLCVSVSLWFILFFHHRDTEAQRQHRGHSSFAVQPHLWLIQNPKSKIQNRNQCAAAASGWPCSSWSCSSCGTVSDK